MNDPTPEEIEFALKYMEFVEPCCDVCPTGCDSTHGAALILAAALRSSQAKLKDTEERLDVHDGRRFSHGCSAVIKLVAHERDTAREELKAMKTRAEEVEANLQTSEGGHRVSINKLFRVQEELERFKKMIDGHLARAEQAEKERDSLAEKLREAENRIKYLEGKLERYEPEKVNKQYSELLKSNMALVEEKDALAARLQKAEVLAGTVDNYFNKNLPHHDNESLPDLIILAVIDVKKALEEYRANFAS